MVGLDDLESLYQTRLFYDSIIYIYIYFCFILVYFACSVKNLHMHAQVVLVQGIKTRNRIFGHKEI